MGVRSFRARAAANDFAAVHQPNPRRPLNEKRTFEDAYGTTLSVLFECAKTKGAQASLFEFVTVASSMRV